MPVTNAARMTLPAWRILRDEGSARRALLSGGRPVASARKARRRSAEDAGPGSAAGPGMDGASKEAGVAAVDADEPPRNNWLARGPPPSPSRPARARPRAPLPG